MGLIKKIIFYCFSLSVLSFAQRSWQSDIVYFDNNRLVYETDTLGNKIPDFSYAGYKNSDESIPLIPVVKTISPVSGDNTAHIQSALFEVGLMTPDSNGFRGALLLQAGLYEIAGTIRIVDDRVAVRGDLRAEVVESMPGQAARLATREILEVEVGLVAVRRIEDSSVRGYGRGMLHVARGRALDLARGEIQKEQSAIRGRQEQLPIVG